MNKRKITSESMMAKADKACSSAKVLLEIGDVDGASNRAYHAMFDAARAALLASGSLVDSDIGKTHSGLNQHFILSMLSDFPNIGTVASSRHPIFV